MVTHRPLKPFANILDANPWNLPWKIIASAVNYLLQLLYFLFNVINIYSTKHISPLDYSLMSSLLEEMPLSFLEFSYYIYSCNIAYNRFINCEQSKQKIYDMNAT